MTSMTLYWLIMLDNILNTINGIGCVAFCALVGAVSGYIALLGEDYEENEKHQAWCARIVRWSASILAGVALLVTFTPSTKQLAAIILVPRVLASPQVANDLPELYNLAKLWARDALPTAEKQ